jgi:predicted PurR-regulated permease PerM
MSSDRPWGQLAAFRARRRRGPRILEAALPRGGNGSPSETSDLTAQTGTPQPRIPGVSARLITAFLVLGSLAFGLFVVDRVVTIAGGFSSILLVIFLAWLLSFLVAQAAEGLRRRLGIRRGLAIALVYVGVILFIGLLIYDTVQVGAHDTADILSRSSEVTARIHALLVGAQKTLGLSRNTIDLAATFDQGQQELFATISASLNNQVQAIAGTTLSVLGNLFVIVVLSLYAVVDVDAILGALSRLVPSRYAIELSLVVSSVGRAFGGFLRTQVILVTIQVLLTIVVGVIFGLPYLFVTTLVVALAMFIPFFGPPLALIPPLLVAVAFRPEVAIPVVLILLVVQTILVNVLQPRLMRESAGLHPILVLLALLVGSQVAGLWGAFFGIPFVAVLNLLVRFFINRRVVNEVEGIDLEDAVAEVQAVNPEISLDEAVAIAADQATDIAADQQAHASDSESPA